MWMFVMRELQMAIFIIKVYYILAWVSVKYIRSKTCVLTASIRLHLEKEYTGITGGYFDIYSSVGACTHLL